MKKKRMNVIFAKYEIILAQGSELRMSRLDDTGYKISSRRPANPDYLRRHCFEVRF